MRTALFCLLLVVHWAALGADEAAMNRDLLAACMNYANQDQLDKCGCVGKAAPRQPAIPEPCIQVISHVIFRTCYSHRC